MITKKSTKRLSLSVEVDVDTDRGAKARLALLRAGVLVFGASSFESASTREIARVAGVNSAALSYYFGGKQGLYTAVMHYVAQAIELRVTPLLDSASELLARDRQAPSDCLRHLSRLLESSALRTNDDELLALSNIIVREQTRSTEAFDVLYDRVLGRSHRIGEQLMAAYVTGNPSASGFSVRFHALLGQALAFRVARSTAIRAAGWATIGVRQEAEIKEVVLEHTVFVLEGLRASHQSSVGRPVSRPRESGSVATRRSKAMR